MEIAERKLVLKEDILKVLKALQILEGDTILVHTALSQLGYVCGGPQIIIEALIEAVGENGTIMMPTQSWKNLDPSTGVHWEEKAEWWQVIRDHWPAYDKDITPTNTMGAVAEMFRTWPNTLRSDHPARSFAAYGKHAKYLINNHDLSNIFGIDSPLDKFYQLDGKVILLGVGYDKNTSIHLADALANYPSKHHVEESSAIKVEGKRQWVTYETLFVDGEDFKSIGKAFEEAFMGQDDIIQIGQIGNATVKMMKQRALVDYAVGWIEKNRR